MLKRAELETKILRRMAEDPGFRERLMANPRATIEAEFKLALSPAVNVTLHEDTPNALHLVLPPEDTRRALASLAPLAVDDRTPFIRAAR